VSRASQARRIAVAAAYGGGSIGLLGIGAYGLLLAEAKLARRWIGAPTSEPPLADGRHGDGDGPAIRLALLGDSSAAGLGVHDPLETPGAAIALGLSAASGRQVELANVAKSGAESADLERQVPLALEHAPEVALIMVGANDVTHRVRPALAVRSLQRAVTKLREAGCEVVVGTCPDLGTVEPIQPPLRWIARRASREMAAAQTIAVVEAGGRTVSLGDVLGPEFAARPGEMFGPDRFHPSAEGYAAAAAVLLPSVRAAAGLAPSEEEVPDQARGEGVLPVAEAAVEAADEAGTEVAGVEVGGRERGPWGRWALLRRRILRPAPTAGRDAADLVTRHGLPEVDLPPGESARQQHSAVAQ
jgi:lysophospholipase L1-like esterase